MSGGGEGINRMKWSLTCQASLVKVKIIYSELCKDVWAKTEDFGSINEHLDGEWDVVSGKPTGDTDKTWPMRGCWLTIIEQRLCLLKAFSQSPKKVELKTSFGFTKEMLVVHSRGIFHKCSWGLHEASRLWITPDMDSNKCLGWEDATWLLLTQVSQWTEAGDSSKKSTGPAAKHLGWNPALLNTNCGISGSIN